jgi:hypothetical protein
MEDEPKKKPPPPVGLNRAQRRALKGGRMKLIEGGKHPDAPSVDMSQPAGRFAFYLHEFIVRHFARNPDLDRTAACAAALQVAAKLAIELDGNEEGFVVAARHFFTGEWQARRGAPPPPKGTS